jgi:hypothetical protein
MPWYKVVKTIHGRRWKNETGPDKQLIKQMKAAIRKVKRKTKNIKAINQFIAQALLKKK